MEGVLQLIHLLKPIIGGFQLDIGSGSDLPGETFEVLIHFHGGRGLTSNCAVSGFKVKHGLACFLCQRHETAVIFQ